MTPDNLFALLETASCGAYVVSLDQTIVFWSRNAEQILGHNPRDVQGRRCYEIVIGQSPGALTAECLGGCPSVRYLRAGLVPTPTRLSMLCANGEHKWVTVNPMVVTGVFRDAPLLVHLFDDKMDTSASVSTFDYVRQDLESIGADVVSQHPGASGTTPEVKPVLTPRELEVLRLVALGWETPRIAAELGISHHTVRNHVRNFRQKLGATTKLDAVVAGMRLGILNVA